MTLDALEATTGQRQAIDKPADSRTFVVAGPGAGKTWTLLQRAKILAERDDISTDSVLTLSFTRAVVGELRRRDKEMAAVTTLRPETFDSFATRLLTRHSVDERWARGGYERRIKAATALIARGLADETLDEVEHILVDEVQDLVGARAELVMTLLGRHVGGFTAFGDPAQAVYDHDADGDGRGPDLIGALMSGLADGLVRLEGNHRASGELADAVATVRQAILDEDVDDAAGAVADAFFDLDTLGPFDEIATLMPLLRGSKAVLCRDNATALLLSRALHEKHVDHRIRRGTSDRPVAGWVGAVLSGSMRLSQDQCARRLTELESVGYPDLPSAHDAWRLLSRLDPRARGGAVRAAEVASALAVGNVPYELNDAPEHEILISSIHRAKGLEFDTCVIPDWRHQDDVDTALETRVLFVALSRARRDCLQAGRRDRSARWYRSKKAQGRFTKRGSEVWQTFGIEVLGGDVHALDPGGSLVIDVDAPDLQSRLVAEVRPGDEVTLEFSGLHELESAEVPIYAVRHASSGLIGITGHTFGDAMRRQLGKRFPARITDIHVDDLETVKGPSAGGDAAGLGLSGLWIRPRLLGLGDFDWKGD